MKLTNNYGIPSSFIDAELGKEYSKGDADFSASGLSRPAQQVALSRAYFGEIEEDITDRIFAMLGTALHEYLEKADQTGLTEKRYFAEFDGYKVSGQIDRLVRRKNGRANVFVLQDYKVVTTWEYKFGIKEDKVAQLNVYAELLRQNGQRVDRLEIVQVFRDWSKSASLRDAKYPPAPVNVLEVELWPEDEAQTFIRERIAALTADPPAPCSPEERWEKPTTYAVKKKGQKRALRVFESMDEAVAYQKNNPENKLVIETRPGESTRCEHYCSVRKWCKQYADSVEV